LRGVCHCASLGPVLLPAEARAVNLSRLSFQLVNV
jgi:hypothetical protein